MSRSYSEPSLEEAVRELGGDQEDLSLVADADFSGSDFEDIDFKSSDNGLQSEVEKMWSQLNGSKATEKEAKQTKLHERAQVPAEPTKGTTDARKSPDKTSTTKKELAESSSINPSEKNKLKPARTVTPKPNLKPDSDIPKPISKKTRKAWEDYLAGLTHPTDAVIFEADPWYEVAQSSTEAPEAPHPEFASALKVKARMLLDMDNTVYYKQRSKDRDFSSSLEFLKSGTFSDQLGTLSILSTESPLHSMRFLENLAAKCDVKNRESACKALEVTKDLLVSHVLPDRRLRWFKDQPISLGVPAAQLIAWSFEDFLKQLFFKLLQAMERLLADTVENIRLRTLHAVFGFFQQKPEQEANLLRLGLNKLGDPSGKVASRVKRLLMDSLQAHPGMKAVVATSMAEVLGRSNDYRTRYYAVDTLTEFILSSRDPGLANQLIYIYLNLFERLLAESKNQQDARVEKAPAQSKVKTGKRFRQKRGKKGGISQAAKDTSEVETQQQARLVAKIFTGLNRAMPFSNLDASVFSRYTDTLYQMSHSPNVGTFIEALSFIFQLSKSTAPAAQGGNDRYYRTLYDSLLDPRLPQSSKLGKYIQLLLRSVAGLAAESEVPRSTAFAKRLLQIASNWSEVGAAASLIHVASRTPHIQYLIDARSADDTYDAKSRDPRFAKAETSRAWETVLLERHFHPTVALYSANLLAPSEEKQALDMPDIEQYTVNSFLSKWSYKKPKTRDSARGGSIFQPLSGFTDLTLGIRQQRKDLDDLPASMKDWKSQNAADIAPEEKFLYDYFSQRPDRPKKQAADASEPKQEQGDSDADSLDEDEINDAMGKSGPGDLDGAEMDELDMDSESDRDLEEGLAAAFSDSDSEAEVEGEPLNSDEDASDIDESNEGDADDAFAAFDGELEPFEQDSGDDAEEKETDGEGDDKKKRQKRKREWSSMPMFLDADALEELERKQSEQQTSSKRRR